MKESLQEAMRESTTLLPGQGTNYYYLVIACVLHLLNLQTVNCLKQTIGEPGMKERSAQQLNHAVWNLQESLKDNFKGFWESHLPGVEPLGEVQQPIPTCWNTHLFAAEKVQDRRNDICALSQSIINHFPADAASNRIASNVLSLTEEEVINSDTDLMVLWFRSYVKPHTMFFEKPDPYLGKSGYLLHHMLPRIFLVHSDLT